VREDNSGGEEWRGTNNSGGRSGRAKQKPKQAATKAMKQWYFEQCKKTNKRNEKKNYKPLVKKKER